MAQGLYGEWFVKVLFPGHEKARVVDSPLGKIPEGLGLATFAEVLSDLDLGSQPKGGIGPKIFEKRGINAITAPKDGESSPFTHGKRVNSNLALRQLNVKHFQGLIKEFDEHVKY